MSCLRGLALLNAPVVAGVLLMIAGGATASLWAGQLVAAGVGVLLCFAVRHAPQGSLRVAWALVATAFAALVASLAAPGLDGVHRWLVAGGLRLDVSQLVTPSLLVFAARQPAAAKWLLVALQLVHVVQPDAGQASAVAVAALLLRPGPAVTAAVVALAVASWWRPDPLGPAAFVEDALARAFAVGALPGAAAMLSLLAAALAFVDGGSRRGGVALAGYLLATVAVACTERFPVPLLGYGASSVLGLSLALAVSADRRPGVGDAAVAR